jgi:hypothetical protein
MTIHLWHFAGLAQYARGIQDEGFWDESSHEFGTRSPCFSLAGERQWEKIKGPALVEVWIDIEEQALAMFAGCVIDGLRTIVYYQIPPHLLNAPGVKRLAHDDANHLPRTPEAYAMSRSVARDLVEVIPRAENDFQGVR